VLAVFGILFFAGLLIGALWPWKPMGGIVLCISLSVLLFVLFENWDWPNIRASFIGGWGPISSWLTHWSIGFSMVMSPLALGALIGLSVQRRIRRDRN
jgi:hypothetical protein